jgi:ABC-type uncharacterized transport system permease subunit
MNNLRHLPTDRNRRERQHLESDKSFLERLNAGLIVAVAFCIAVWMVLLTLFQGYVAR